MSTPPQHQLMADISDYQATVDLRAYRRAGRRLIMIKAADHDTPAGAIRYPTRAHEAHRLGLHVIHYIMAQFATPAAATVDYAVRRILPLWRHGDQILIDVEDYSGPPQQATPWLKAAQTRLHDHHKAPKALAYTNEAYLAAAGAELADEAPDWIIAAYDGLLLGRGTPILPHRTHAQLLGKQYTDGQIGAQPHIAPGIGPCDNTILTCTGTRHLLAGPAPKLRRRKIPRLCA